MSKYHLSIQDFNLSYNKHILLDSQTVTIRSGQRIGIIGRNGTGKSSLLQFLYEEAVNQFNFNAQYVPQLLEQSNHLSGGEHLINCIYLALLHEPEILFLDEPTNHLDATNRNLLFNKLSQYSGTLVFVSHDIEMLTQCTEQIWHIENLHINKFEGNYYDFTHEQNLLKAEQNALHNALKKQSKMNHTSLMHEQHRASKAKQKGIKSIKSNKYATIKSPTKVDRGNKTANKRKQSLKEVRSKIMDKRGELFIQKKIVPTFTLTWQKYSGPIIQISAGSVGYEFMILNSINLVINAGQKVWLQGKNGSGKSTLLKAFMAAKDIKKTGQWHSPKISDIGYVDQFYQNLNNDITVFESIKRVKTDWSDHSIRVHLNDYLFKTNIEVEAQVVHLSEGEKARLSFAIIGCKTPKILILDEITNNLDIETKQHVIDVLNAYPGTLLFICHEKVLAEQIKIDKTLRLHDGGIRNID